MPFFVRSCHYIVWECERTAIGFNVLEVLLRNCLTLWEVVTWLLAASKRGAGVDIETRFRRSTGQCVARLKSNKGMRRRPSIVASIWSHTLVMS